ncbi:MAG: non-ribosomal peptide synthetase, partial [Dactylosporangium sp.]|nr:amino acid adenylation domain-containing protein [Dactylosporangium sp.]NNJ62051.1 non-ribosomal peptide synthetase [Dactylosporangium sp.]
GLRTTPLAAGPGAVIAADLGREDTAALAAAAHAAGVTRFEWLLTAIGVLLRRYGDASPVVAVDVSTRPWGTEDTIGLFVNELPVPLPDGGGKTFAEVATATRGLLREIYRYRAVPAGRVISGLRPAAAVAPVSVSYRRGSAPTPTFEGLHTDVDWTVFNGAARNALHVQAVDHGETITVRLSFSPAALEPAAAARIGGHLRTLVAAAAAQPWCPVGDLPILPEDEYHTLVHGWNDTARPYPREATLDGLFTEQIRLRPDAPAVTFEGETLTYADLDVAVDALAARLRQAGVSAGDLVAVRLPRSRDLLVAFLAVGRIGAAYLPVDPAYPEARQATVLWDAKPLVVVTADWLAERRAEARPAGEVSAPAGRVAGTGPDDLSNVIYTSGSTGRPKGVEITRGGLANLLLALRDDLGSTGEDVWLALTSPSFDIAAVELYLPLVSGGRVVIAPESATRDGAAANHLIRTCGVTHVQATPSGWRMLLETGFGEGIAPGREPVAVTGGEALPLALATALRARTRRLFNGYGPSETTIYSTMEEIPRDPTAVTIGRPVANTTVYLLDGEDRLVPIGVEGDLVIGGVGVATGYLGQADLTAERFGTDPFLGRPARMYRTGDRARYRADGRIDFLGRHDNQIKIRGHRVELGEVEHRLLEHPSVARAAVALRQAQREDADPRLVAYVVPAGGTMDPPVLRQYLAGTLPMATVPTAWVRLDRLPLTPNGKLDRAALPEPPPPGPEADDPGRPPAGVQALPERPADPIAEEIRSIWQDVLGIPDIADDEDLFDLGGHSLTITRISARITKRLGVAVPLDVFYDTPTVAEIAVAVQSHGGAR